MYYNYCPHCGHQLQPVFYGPQPWTVPNSPRLPDYYLCQSKETK
jgi:phage terminase large subunit GpA-like protein